MGRFYAFAPVDTAPLAGPSRFDAGGRPVPRLAGAGSGAMIAELVQRVDEEAKTTRRPVVLAFSSHGAASRLTDLFTAFDNAPRPSQITDLTAATRGGLYLMQWPLDAGFETDKLLVFAEPDLFGQKLSRPALKAAVGKVFYAKPAPLKPVIWSCMSNMV